MGGRAAPRDARAKSGRACRVPAFSQAGVGEHEHGTKHANGCQGLGLRAEPRVARLGPQVAKRRAPSAARARR